MPNKNTLFLCSGAIDRSPCGASLVKNAKYAGIGPLTETPVSEELICWADLIICFEHWHKVELWEQIPKSIKKKIVVLNVPNDYLRYDPELEKILRRKLEEIDLI